MSVNVQESILWQALKTIDSGCQIIQNESKRLGDGLTKSADGKALSQAVVSHLLDIEMALETRQFIIRGTKAKVVRVLKQNEQKIKDHGKS